MEGEIGTRPIHVAVRLSEHLIHPFQRHCSNSLPTAMGDPTVHVQVHFSSPTRTRCGRSRCSESFPGTNKPGDENNVNGSCRKLHPPRLRTHLTMSSVTPGNPRTKCLCVRWPTTTPGAMIKKRVPKNLCRILKPRHPRTNRCIGAGGLSSARGTTTGPHQNNQHELPKGLDGLDLGEKPSR